MIIAQVWLARLRTGTGAASTAEAVVGSSAAAASASAAGSCMHVAPLDRVPMGPRSIYRYWLVVGDQEQIAARLDELWAAHAGERAELIPQAADP